MKLKAKILPFLTEGPLIGIINKKDAQTLDLEALDRIKIKKGNKSQVVATDIAYGKKEVKPGEIGLFVEAAEKLKIKENEKLDISLELKPKSIQYIKKKLDKQELDRKEISQIIRDLLKNKLTEVETTFFVSACYTNKMTLDESAYLAEAIVNSDGRLRWKKREVVNKHCIGGLAGNRTTLPVVAIVAAAGLTIPKTSTRSITSPSGTADTMEVLAPVEHSKEKLKRIVNKTKGCIVWGGALDLASADDKLIRLEKQLNLDPEGFLLASILSKKAASGSTHSLIDIPVGPETKIKTKERAKDLSKKFVTLGKKLNMKIKVMISDGTQPLGKGIGPALEARDVLLMLQNEKGFEDLKKKSIYMASLIFDMVGYKHAKEKAKRIFESGRAYKKLKEIISAQGGNPKIKPEDIKIGEHKHTFKAHKKGKVSHISNKLVSKIAKSAGAPIDKGAGIYLHKKLKDKINLRDPLFTIYAENKEKLVFAMKENLNEVYSIN